MQDLRTKKRPHGLFTTYEFWKPILQKAHENTDSRKAGSDAPLQDWLTWKSTSQRILTALVALYAAASAAWWEYNSISDA